MRTIWTKNNRNERLRFITEAQPIFDVVKVVRSIDIFKCNKNKSRVKNSTLTFIYKEKLLFSNNLKRNLSLNILV